MRTVRSQYRAWDGGVDAIHHSGRPGGGRAVGAGLAGSRPRSDTIPRPDGGARSSREREVARQDPVKLLGGVPLFEGLSKQELTQIARAAKEVTHREGSTLAREGQSGVGFFLIT